MRDIISAMMAESEARRDQPHDETWLRVCPKHKDHAGQVYGFSREFRERSEDYIHGLTLEQARALAGRGGKVYRIVAHVERVV
jgi:hypothetical protein